MPIAGPIGSSPVELELMTRKQPAGKDHDEAVRGIGNVGDHAVDSWRLRQRRTARVPIRPPGRRTPTYRNAYRTDDVDLAHGLT